MRVRHLRPKRGSTPYSGKATADDGQEVHHMGETGMLKLDYNSEKVARKARMLQAHAGKLQEAYKVANDITGPLCWGCSTDGYRGLTQYQCLARCEPERALAAAIKLISLLVPIIDALPEDYVDQLPMEWTEIEPAEPTPASMEETAEHPVLVADVDSARQAAGI